MSRFYIPRDSVRHSEIRLSGEAAHHILDVMRLRERDKIVAFDGSGKEYEGIIRSADKKSLVISVINTKEAARSDGVEITLIQAIPKRDKMDYIVEKATELGVVAILPTITGRTIVQLKGEKARKRRDRWEKIAAQASRQCGRLTIPVIETPAIFEKVTATFCGYDRVLIASLDEDARDLKEVLAGSPAGRVALCIGPEGDFTKEEADAARSSGAVPVTLGPRILKSDTAGLALVSIVSYELNRKK